MALSGKLELAMVTRITGSKLPALAEVEVLLAVLRGCALYPSSSSSSAEAVVIAALIIIPPIVDQ